jgi:hypothetical protein
LITDLTPAALEGAFIAFLIAGFAADAGAFNFDDAGKFGVDFAIVI